MCFGVMLETSHRVDRPYRSGDRGRGSPSGDGFLLARWTSTMTALRASGSASMSHFWADTYATAAGLKRRIGMGPDW